MQARHRNRIVLERLAFDSERVTHVVSAPADNMAGFRGGREPIGRLVAAVGPGVPWRKLVALGDRGLKALLQAPKGLAEMRLQRADRVPAKQTLGSVM